MKKRPCNCWLKNKTCFCDLLPTNEEKESNTFILDLTKPKTNSMDIIKKCSTPLSYKDLKRRT